MYDLIGEHLTGEPAEWFSGSRATDWGNEFEAEALKEYTKKTGRKIQKADFFQHPELDLVGGTPDALCGESGLIEVKCPLTYKNHLRTVIEKKVPDEYWSQVLGHMLISGRKWCDFVSYDPRIKTKARIAIVRIKAEDYKEEMSELEERLTEFQTMLKDKLSVLIPKKKHPAFLEDGTFIGTD